MPRFLAFTGYYWFQNITPKSPILLANVTAHQTFFHPISTIALYTCSVPHHRLYNRNYTFPTETTLLQQKTKLLQQKPNFSNKKLHFSNEKLDFSNEKLDLSNKKLNFSNKKLNLSNKKLNFSNKKLNFSNKIPRNGQPLKTRNQVLHQLWNQPSPTIMKEISIGIF